jgi:hypothetical protein
MHAWFGFISLDIGYERRKASSDILQGNELCEVRNPASIIAFLSAFRSSLA